MGDACVIKFKTPEITDKPWIDELLAHSDFRGCEYTFSNLFAWNELYETQVARFRDFLLVHFVGAIGPSYLYPAGRGDWNAVLEVLKEDAALRGERLQIMSLTEEIKAAVERCSPGQFAFVSDRADYDYLYLTDKLADLSGKRLHAKRNHINRFLEQNDNWRFEPLTAENLNECLALDQAWNLESGLKRENAAKMETGALIRTLEHFKALKLEGGILRADGLAVAFAIGEKLNSDTYDIHFEKALASVTGAYAMINREFARFIRENHPEIKYVNREDDLGLPGLRQAKLSYYPDLMLVKYSAVFQSEAGL